MGSIMDLNMGGRAMCLHAGRRTYVVAAVFSVAWFLGGAEANAQTYTQTEEITYHDNTTKWVLGQVAQRKVNGTVVAATTFDSNSAQPLTQRSFGKLQQTLTYHPDGAVAMVKDGNNQVTTLNNWHRGIPRNIGYADGTSVSAVVDDRGWISSVTDENGFVTGYTYDPMGRLASVTQPTGDSVAWNTTTQVFARVTTAEYGIPAGHWRQTISTGNARKVTYYDALWRLLLTREYDNGQVTATERFQRFGYDHEGRVTFASYPGATATLSTGTWTEYDPLGRVTSVSQDSEQGLLTTLTEYPDGFRTRVTNPRGVQTLTSYKAFDQPTYDWPIQIEHAVGRPEYAVTAISRDDFGKPTALVRRNGAGTTSVTRSYAYNGYQELCRTVEPETGATLFGYDAAGTLKWSAAGLPAATACEVSGTSPAVAARRVDRSYDARNRLATLSFPDGRGNQSWSYAPDGAVTSITTNNSSGGSQVINRYTYNKRRLLVGESLEQVGRYTWSIGYEFNANGQLSTLTYPGGERVQYAPNALGQPTQVLSQVATYASALSWYPNGSLRQFTYGNGVVHAMTQNARQLPSRVTSSGGASELAYSYDANGNVASIVDYAQGAQFNRTLQYDAADRLVAAGSPSFGGDGWHRFAYDALDNMQSWTLAGVKDHHYYYDPSRNQLNNVNTSAGATVVGLEYDAQGNLASRNGQAYVFDYGNRLREVTGKETYRYDGHGRRVEASHPTQGNILSLYGQDGVLRYQSDFRARKMFINIYLAGSLLATREIPFGSSVSAYRYHHTDALGSPVTVTNEAGQVVERTQYEPYGAPIGKTFSGIGYTGHVMDGVTGLTYMQQRYYDPGIGRFLSVDPVTANSDTGANFNRYWYANNNPYKFTDPDGREAADRAYGAAVGFMLRNDPEKLRIWAGGEAAATTEGSGAEQGAVMGQTAGEFVDAGDYSGEAVGGAALKIAFAAAVRGKGKGKGGGSEHTKNARPSTKGKHEAGQARKQRDRGGEKGDKDRRAPRKPPPDHKGPWPPKDDKRK